MNTKIKAKALKTLDGLETIVRNERFVQGDYITQDVDPEFSGAICGGRKACLIGSLYLSYGVKPTRVRRYGDSWVTLKGVHASERNEFMRNHPALRAAYDALNTAAEHKIRRDLMLRKEYDLDKPTEDSAPHEGFAESLFEGNNCSSRGELLRLIKSARREIETTS